jgi:23S rRNA pseudouridine1911/1915/1917 synthase
MPQATFYWQIVHEDRDLLVVRKPAGLLTSTVPRERRPTLLAQVRQHVYQTQPRARVGLIHRLDRDASGLLVFSKSHQAYLSLKSQFYHHSVDRGYTALVQGVLHPRQGTLRSRLVERADGTVHSTHRPGAGQAARTDYQTIACAAGRSLLRLTLHTGRKHQVRVHLAERGAPIVGDPLYGRPDPAGLHLMATCLAFDHPRTAKRLEFRLPPPPWLG